MSMGYSAFATLICETQTELLYAYGCCNLNLPGYQDARTRQDGLIRIKRSAIPFPTKACLADGSLEIVNAKAAWSFRENGVDVMALRLLDKISDHFQQTDQPPEKVGFVW